MPDQPRHQHPTLDIRAYGALISIGLGFYFFPTVFDLSQTVWETEQQGHGSIVFAVATWLLWRTSKNWPKFHEDRRDLARGSIVIVAATILYLIGRTQSILFLEVGALPILMLGIGLSYVGRRALASSWFPIFFLIFLIPLPAPLVDALTQPMKYAVSLAVAWILNLFSYPVAQSGVTLHLGPYRLLVADACAGLNTLFTLEAIGLVYLNVVTSSSTFRNITLGILIIPISFLANVIRVLALCLITYYLGDQAGQGFLHSLAGFVLFGAALGLTIIVDWTIAAVIRRAQRKPERTSVSTKSQH